jgi:hypothetical protein
MVDAAGKLVVFVVENGGVRRTPNGPQEEICPRELIAMKATDTRFPRR